jgi:hypothetical protein
MCLAAASEIQAILAENLELVAEVNSWREQYSAVGMTTRHVKPINDAVLELLKVDQEVLGTFPGGFGDNGVGEEHDDEQGVEKGSRAQMEEQKDPMPSHFPPNAVTRTVSKVPLNLPEDPSVYALTGTHPLPAESNHLSATTAIPISNMASMENGFIDPNRMPIQQIISPNHDLFSFFHDGFGVSPTPHAGILPPSNNSAGLNMHHDVYHDIIMAQPEMGYYLAPGTEGPNF